MSWWYLSFAIVFEVCGTSLMKLSFGLSKLWPSIGMFGCYAASFSLLALALKTIDVSIAYAIWSGVGIVLITIIDYFVFHAHLTLIKFFAIFLILCGVVLLKALPG